MTLTKDDLGKFFYIIEYDIRGYIQILRCKLIEISFTNKHELEDNNNNITSISKTYVTLKFGEDYYTPNVNDVYRTLTETLEPVKKIINKDA